MNIMLDSVFRSVSVNAPFEPPDSTLTSYSGDNIRVVRKITLPCSYANKTIIAQFYIVENSATPLLGLQSSIDLELIQLTFC